MIVDEPTVGLDPVERVNFRNLIAGLAGDRIIIFFTHIVSDVEATATDIALINQGRLLTHASSEVLLQAVKGRVWGMLIPSELLTETRQTYLVTSTTRRQDGILARVVNETVPSDQAQPLTPNLEDAYLHMITNASVEVV